LPQPSDPTNKANKREYNALDVATLVLGIFTFAAIIGYATITGWLASLTAQSVAISQKQFEMSQRPWVYPDISIVGPLNFDEDGGARVSVRFDLKNIGHSVAVYVTPSVGLFPLQSIADIAAVQRNQCVRAH
jgi:hypothetical protein